MTRCLDNRQLTRIKITMKNFTMVFCVCMSSRMLFTSHDHTTTKLGKNKCWTCLRWMEKKKYFFIHFEPLHIQLYLRSRTVTFCCWAFGLEINFFGLKKKFFDNQLWHYHQNAVKDSLRNRQREKIFFMSVKLSRNCWRRKIYKRSCAK